MNLCKLFNFFFEVIFKCPTKASCTHKWSFGEVTGSCRCDSYRLNIIPGEAWLKQVCHTGPRRVYLCPLSFNLLIASWCYSMDCFSCAMPTCLGRNQFWIKSSTTLNQNNVFSLELWFSVVVFQWPKNVTMTFSIN